MSSHPNRRLAVLLVLAIILSMALGTVAGGIAGGIAGYTLATLRGSADQTSLGDGTGLLSVNTAVTPSRLSVQESSASIDATRKAGPAVVTVITTLQTQPGQRTPTVEPTASGSGIILDKSGHILTNNHVIDGQKKITIIFADGTQSDAQLVGGDAMADLAILKVDAAVPAVAELGDSDALVSGERVLAIGSALGDFRNTVTGGVVSGLGRSLPGVDYRLDNLIQTDAAINHGNSGGPLINLSGQVVGINVAIYRGSTLIGDTSVQGVGFAIPVNTASVVAQQLIATGKVTRPYLGVTYQMLTPQLASYYKVNQKQGAYVTGISANTPAAKAGIQEKDVISAIDDRPLGDTYSLFTALLFHHPGDTVRTTVMRGDKALTLNVVLTERPAGLN
jgi:2-alkenal reductase